MSTELQQRVWCALTLIPKGRVTTYGLLARHLNTRAIRAVASAVGKNPNAPRVPCHRVVRTDGTVGGYSGRGGVPRKLALLRQEGVCVDGERIHNLNEVLYTFSR